MRRPSVAAVAALGGMLLSVSGCALLTATPPTIEVQRVELHGVGLLNQSLGVMLCVTNPNDTELDFRQVTVVVDVTEALLAQGASETPVRLAPRSSTLVPFAVVTTARNLVPQLLGVLRAGRVDYRLHGSIQLTGALAITLPFSHSGRLDLLTVGQDVLADAASPSRGTRCRVMAATAPMI